MVKAQVPERISVTMYQVGFGDCFLLSFHYGAALDDGRTARHLLIDYGSTHQAEGSEIADVAKLLMEHTDGILDAVVISHRHRDHLSGLANSDVQRTFDALAPRFVLRPWTEDPQLAPDSDGPPAAPDADVDCRYVGTLAAAQRYVGRLDPLLSAAVGDGDRFAALADAIQGEAQMSLGVNENAMRLLNGWAAGGRGRYASYGTDVGLEDAIPGVHCDVLGPPLIRDHEAITRQRYDDAHEFWLAQDQVEPDDLLPAEGGTIRKAEQTLAGPTRLWPARWLLDKLNARQHEHVAELVDAVDHAINNTSLILVITAGERRMLFPGDAQIENWEYVLGKDPGDPLRSLLSKIDLYKVGHHGSRNATPRTLLEKVWNAAGAKGHPMVGLMSTKSQVHGKGGPNPVPKQQLIDALEKRMTLYRTDTLETGELFLRVEASSVQDGIAFARVM